jgi:hypothetical protein
MPRENEQAADTAPASSDTENDAHTVARLEALAKSPDPMGAAFGAATLAAPVQTVPAPAAATEAPKAKDAPATPPPATPGGNPADPRPQPDGAEPPPRPRPQAPDPDTASPDELRAYARQHPNWAKAMGLEVRDHLQKRTAELQREQAARQQAEANAKAANDLAQQNAEQARMATELYDAYWDEEDPRHLDALRFYAQLGVQPMEIQKVIGSPVVQQHVGLVAQQAAQDAANQAAYQAEQAALATSIQSAAAHPVLGTLGDDALEKVWQEVELPADGRLTPAVVAEFYDRAYLKAGYMTPSAAEQFRKEYKAAAEASARTKVYGEQQPAEGSVVAAGLFNDGRSIPTDKKLLDPMELLTRGFANPQN